MTDKPDTREKMRFFNVSLINGNIMSTPRFEQPQRLVGELIHSIEAASPRFAWIQLLFRRVNFSSTFTALKNSIHAATEQIKRPRVSIIDGSEHDTAELHRDWYTMAGERMKGIVKIVNKPHVLLAIQGLWVGDPKLLSVLPFKDCYDEHDRLGVFVYRNPWMLAELVERRMVTNISSYFRSYTGSRLEPPSFVVTPEEIPYYIHLPVVKQTDALKSVRWTQHSSEVREGSVEGSESKGEVAGSKIVRLVKVPWISEPLKDKEIERLHLLPSTTVRGFELLFAGNRAELLLSSWMEKDLVEYVGVMESVYGELGVEPASQKVNFLKEIPEIVGLQAKVDG